MAPIKLLASQAHSVNSYKNLRTKGMRCCANIYFNRQSLNKKVILKYANLKVAHTFPASNITSKKIHMIHIKDEIKFLYKKKEELNNYLCKTHLQAAQNWGSIWYIILESLHESINQELENYSFCLMVEASDHGYVLHTRRIHVTRYRIRKR
jgi:hypothetical protein